MCQLRRVSAQLWRRLRGTVLRAKGVVPAADGDKWIHFDHVPGEVEIRRGAAGLIGRLCVIGSKMNEDALKALFTE